MGTQASTWVFTGLNPPLELSPQPPAHFSMMPGALHEPARGCWHLSLLSSQDQKHSWHSTPRRARGSSGFSCVSCSLEEAQVTWRMWV